MTTSKIRWGILATGAIAATFTEDLLLLDDAEVVAVGSRTAEAAQAFADRFGIPRAHGSWAGLAADPDVDIVYVATPHSAHLEAARVSDAHEAFGLWRKRGTDGLTYEARLRREWNGRRTRRR